MEKKEVRAWMTKTIQKALQDQEFPKVDFDEDEIVYQGRQFRSEFKWNIFSCYQEELSTLYYFRTGRVTMSVLFSQVTKLAPTT